MRTSSLACLVIVAGCSRTVAEPSGAAPSPASLSTNSTLDFVLAGDPGMRPFAVARRPWSAAGPRLSSFGALTAHAPSSPSGPFVVEANGHRCELRLRGAASGAASVEDDRVFYRDAFPHGDLVAMTAEGRFELLAIARDEGATVAGVLELELELAVDADARIVDRGDEIVIADRYGMARLRIPSPYALDARAVRRDAVSRLEGTTLRVRLDTRGLTFPVVLDPGLETATWTVGTSGPPTRYGHQLVYDSVRDMTYMLGGCASQVSGTPSSCSPYHWFWNGSSWSSLSTTTPTRVTTLHWLNPAVAFDRARALVVLFGGGWRDNFTNEVWEFDGANWAKRVVGDTPPPARFSAALAFDTKRRVSVLFGGQSALSAGSVTTEYNDTWTWDGATWKQLLDGSASSPSKRRFHAMAYDEKRDRVVLFGGDTGTSGNALDETWEFDGAVWTPITTPTKPPALTGARMVYDAANERMILLGGNTSQVWAYDGKTWAVLPTTGFTRRTMFGAAYDSKRKMVLAFGGDRDANLPFSSPVPSSGYGDLLQWPVSGCMSGADCGGGSCVAGYCCDTTCSGACQTCAPDGKCTTLPAGARSTDPSCAFLCTGSVACATTCANDAECASDSICTGGSCVRKKPLGASCTVAAECVSLTCVDGFCCDKACAGACEACDVAGSVGRCVAIPKNEAAHGTRTACTGSGPCAGACDGVSTTCAFPGAAINCAPASCGSGVARPISACDGAGTCGASGGVKCDPFVCGATSCKTSCATHDDCIATAYCSVDRCVLRQAEGGGCTSARECASGACVSGVCNASTDAGASDTFAPDASSPDTSTSDDAVVSDTAVAESGDDALPPGQGTPAVGIPKAGEKPVVTGEYTRCTLDSECASGFCVEGICCDTPCSEKCHSCALLGSPGKCLPEPYGVDLKQECGRASQCIGTCGGDGRCVGAGPGTLCARNRCTGETKGVGAAFCAQPGQTCPTGEAVEFDCSPYVCDRAFGACKTACITSDDCQAGQTCDIPTKSCIAPPPPEDEGGCTIGSVRRTPSVPLFVIAAFAMVVRRRRRS